MCWLYEEMEVCKVDVWHICVAVCMHALYVNKELKLCCILVVNAMEFILRMKVEINLVEVGI